MADDLWIAMIPVSIMLGLLASVTYVSALSLWALVSGHLSAVEQLIRETDVQLAQSNAACSCAVTPTSSGDTELRRCIDDPATRIADLPNRLGSNLTR